MRFVLIIFFATLCCCKAVSHSSTQQVTLQKLVDGELGPNANIEKNNSSTFAIAYQSKDRSVEFLVIRLLDLKIILKDKIQGSVSWSGDMKIKVFNTPGIVKLNSKPEDYVKIIDLNNYIIQNK
jgi:hypothetical protein